MKTNNKHKAHAFWGAAFVLLIAMGCTQPTDGNTGGTVTPNPDAPFIEGGASLIVSPDKLDIKVKAVTSDGNPVVLEGCTETTLANDTETELHAKGTRVILKGNIIKLYCGENQLTALNVQGLTALKELYCLGNELTALNVQGLTTLYVLGCSNNQLTALDVQGLTTLYVLVCRGNQLTALNVQGCTALERLGCGGNQLTALNVQGLTALQSLGCYNNQLTALNVQGCTALKELDCWSNKLTAEAFIKIFNDLPQRDAGNRGYCHLYIEEPGVTEGNHTDFTSPSEVQTAFENAKDVKHWKMYKRKMNGLGEEI